MVMNKTQLTENEKNELLEENIKNDFSYQCLLKELFSYNPTIKDLLYGHGGIKLFKI